MHLHPLPPPQTHPLNLPPTCCAGQANEAARAQHVQGRPYQSAGAGAKAVAVNQVEAPTLQAALQQQAACQAGGHAEGAGMGGGAAVRAAAQRGMG